MTEMIEPWRDPVFDQTYQQVPAPLAARLNEMADETRGRDIYYGRLHVLLAVASVASRSAPLDLPTRRTALRQREAARLRDRAGISSRLQGRRRRGRRRTTPRPHSRDREAHDPTHQLAQAALTTATRPTEDRHETRSARRCNAARGAKSPGGRLHAGAGESGHVGVWPAERLTGHARNCWSGPLVRKI
jgi:hypothetical protein